MNELLMHIDQIDQSVADAEINVLESLIQSYDKSIMILQESTDDADLSAFDIFQEGEKWDKFKEDTKAPVLGNKGESVGKRILMLIPRLIQKLIALIKNLFSKEKSEERKMDKDIRELEKIAKSSDSVRESAVDDSTGEIVQEGLRDELKQLKSEFSPKERKQREEKGAQLREDVTYKHSQYTNDRLLEHFRESIYQSIDIYEKTEFAELRDAVKEFDRSKLEELLFGKTRTEPIDRAAYKYTDRQLEAIQRCAFKINETFPTEANRLNAELKNHVLNRTFMMINNDDDTPNRRKRYIQEHLNEIKAIRDSINELHEKRRLILAHVDKLGTDLYMTWRRYQEHYESIHDLRQKPPAEANVIASVMTRTFEKLNKIVYDSSVLNQSIADCWNGLMHAMRGDGKAHITNPYKV